MSNNEPMGASERLYSRIAPGHVCTQQDERDLQEIQGDYEEISNQVTSAWTSGYEDAMAKCDRAEVPELIAQIDRLRTEMALQKAMRSIAERKLETLQGRVAAEPIKQ